MIVLDSSAALEFLTQRSLAAWVAGLVSADPSLHAPHLLDVEIVSALRRLVRAEVVSESRAGSALDDLADLDLSRYPHAPLVPRMWELRETVTAAGAAFVALAEGLGATLVTTDVRLARAPGIRAPIVCP